MRTVSLFTGAGGLDWGFRSLGFNTVIGIDKKLDAAETFSRNFGIPISKGPLLKAGYYSVGDVSQSKLEAPIPPPAVLLGGPPCQDFSIMRGVDQERGGTQTLRGKLYLHFARYLAVLKPLAFVFENVPGLLSSNSGKDISTILEDFTNLHRLPEQWRRQYEAKPHQTPPPPEDLISEANRGDIPSYQIVFSDVVDASWHGVPQRRKRLLIIGFREDLPVRMDHILAIKEALAGSPALRKYPLTALEALEGTILPELREIYREIVSEYSGLFSGDDPVSDYLRLHKGKPNDPLFDQAIEEHEAVIRLLGWKGRSLTSAPSDAFPDGSHTPPREQEAVLARMKQIPPGENHKAVRGTEHEVEGRGFSLIYRRLHPLLPAYTVVAHGGGGTWGYHYRRSRSRLTNRERARLQSFPDTFWFEGKTSKVRSQIGEAVPPLLSLKIAEVMQSILEDVREAELTS
ncbi:DNA cytosine methyltransferase (plasmid) [Thermus sp. PS18]|uniref:DNA cytosine methyltransferase n=1 Tax=Thermus sp. PS18 TaxID=2849039 RepID=UPI0022656865|nr:DNA cytosine methyltransferase [Thermus sp. PS18]UZX16810.1 DNA cytosine methyltransferase [Thermus sp. PS18]